MRQPSIEKNAQMFAVPVAYHVKLRVPAVERQQPNITAIYHRRVFCGVQSHGAAVAVLHPKRLAAHNMHKRHRTSHDRLAPHRRAPGDTLSHQATVIWQSMQSSKTTGPAHGPTKTRLRWTFTARTSFGRLSSSTWHVCRCCRDTTRLPRHRITHACSKRSHEKGRRQRGRLARSGGCSRSADSGG